MEKGMSRHGKGMSRHDTNERIVESSSNRRRNDGEVGEKEIGNAEEMPIRQSSRILAPLYPLVQQGQ